MPHVVTPCPCGSEQAYVDHCGPVHRAGAGLGSSAESLMRARYSAYVMRNEAFLLDSWHHETRPETVDFDGDVMWLGLDVVAARGGTGFDNTGTVEFRARLRRGEQHLELHEVSSFVRVDGQWKYVDGQ